MPVPVISVAQMREWEKASWDAGRTEAEVIRQVGKVVAARALSLTKAGDTVLLLAGKGHNGDDVRAAHENLAGQRVTELLEVTSPDSDLAKLESALARRPALLVDGLFGIGLNRPLDESWMAFVKRINHEKLLVLAVDVPSGLNADTGEPMGAAVEASVTLTVGAPKQGLLRTEAADYVGCFEVAHAVGLIPCPHKSDLLWTLPEDFVGFPPRRPATGHKGNFGHLAIIAGSLGYHGAAVLAARAAQRAQPGLITVLTQESVYHSVAAQLQAVMVNVLQLQTPFPPGFGAFLIGPGLVSPELAEMKISVRRFWRDLSEPVLVDATALDWLASDPILKNKVRVITPHPGEAARLLKMPSKNVQADRRAALRELSRRYGNCWVVLKGHQTLIGRDTGDIFVNPSGNPHLAQGGSGDALAGFIAGLLAQPALQADPAKTIRYAVWQHGLAADHLQMTRRNWVVEDLIETLGNVT